MKENVFRSIMSVGECGEKSKRRKRGVRNAAQPLKRI
jgi:hypothetical protein